MRTLVLALFAMACMGATDVARAPASPPHVVLPDPDARDWPCSGGYFPVFNPEGCPPPEPTIAPAAASAPANCRDKVEQVRGFSGQPALDKTPATPGQGYLIAAVDKRIDGCAVMQMKGDVNDLRPLPDTDGPARLQPAQ